MEVGGASWARLLYLYLCEDFGFLGFFLFSLWFCLHFGVMLSVVLVFFGFLCGFAYLPVPHPRACSECDPLRNG